MGVVVVAMLLAVIGRFVMGYRTGMAWSVRVVAIGHSVVLSSGHILADETARDGT